MHARVARITRTGGPEVIEWVDAELPAPAAGEVLVAHTAVGLNMIDTYYRRGIYPAALPSGLGSEAAGRVVAVGPGVSGLAEGDRVTTFGPTLGAYATARIYRAETLLRLPDAIDDVTAAAATLKGCTAEFLIERCACVEAGMPVLVHAAAGGVGLLLVQWLKHIGAEVIGTVSTEAKARAALAAGADHVINYATDAVAPAVRDLTGGAGVDVAFDGVGQDTWEASLDSVASRGLIVSYGNASAPVTGVALGTLSQKGSLFVTRPTLYHYYADPDEREAGAARVWEMIASGALSVTVGQTYPLEEVARAHAELEARRTTGSTVLLP
ncbi:quinone oxidoreductase [Novosphingobium sp. MMS21-SN21R]|uniref:quinone oxidoreductase family protein n=1 Tax=Novosphingobium sp. MMS21-SN21R TaxID=2969298 RepID=UPI002888839C|nr:quinone oxidoreductase [Novosphingobium sp. MMS21-SN21R]MDT0509536.1 quinone oxidoreductase [Novosphingobium sp. MMS21-SN21R]MDT0510095.1 quinone oxidoreductase [Novosphingobium sp. MMS21-SN21R]